MKIGTFLKRVSKAATVTITANVGNLDIWFVVVFLAGAGLYAYMAAVQVAGVPDSSVRESASPERTTANDVTGVEMAKKCFPTYSHLEWAVYQSLGNGGWVASSDQFYNHSANQYQNVCLRSSAKGSRLPLSIP